jgi:hypothetical protein
VIQAARSTGTLWRRVCLTLAVLAVAMKILVPPGFMAGTQSNDLPFQIYLCTAQGGVTVQSGEALAHRGDPGQAPAKSAHDSPCAFAGHALGATPPSVAEAPAVAFIAYTPSVPAVATHLIPGRGLAGPPLPARGPPALLI